MLKKAFLRSTMLSGIVGAVYLSGNLARAADLAPPNGIAPSWYAPAVDGVNGRVDGFGGTINQKSLGGGQGAVAIPLGGQWGLQFDRSGGSLQNRAFESVGGHLGWRKPWGR